MNNLRKNIKQNYVKIGKNKELALMVKNVDLLMVKLILRFTNFNKKISTINLKTVFNIIKWELALTV